MILLPILLVGVVAGATLFHNDAPPAPRPPSTPWVSESGIANYMMGALADVRGDVSTAANAYLRALADSPDNMSLRHRVFELSLLNGDTDTALRLARAFPEAQQDTLTRLVPAVALAQTGNLPKARSMLHKATKLAPELLQFQLMEGYFNTAQGAKPQAVEKAIRRSKTADVMSAWRDYHLARIWLKQGSLTKAETLLQSAHKAQPQGIMNTLLLAQVQTAMGKGPEATSLLATYKQANPAVDLLVPATISASIPLAKTTLNDDMAATLFDFALLLWGENAMTPARQLMYMAVELAPTNISYRFYAGMLLEVGNDLDAARRMYTPLLAAQNPAGVRLITQIRLSEMKARQGETAPARAVLEKLMAENPEEPAVHRSLAQVAFVMKDYPTAVTHYEWLATHHTQGISPAAEAELLFALGAAYERNGNIEKASRTLMQTVALNRNNPQVLNYLVYMWGEHGQRLEDAFVLLKQAHLLAPHDGSITDSLGWAYHMRNQDETALKYLTKAAEQEPSSPEIISHLADVYAALGRKEDARRQWQRALDVLENGAEPPTPDFAKHLRRKLSPSGWWSNF